MTRGPLPPPDRCLALHVEYQRIGLPLGGMSGSLAVLARGGRHAPILFLHGFGSTKEDYADATHLPAFQSRAVLAFDAPGCGATFLPDLAEASVQLIRDAAVSLMAHHGSARCHIVGHSMGGLAALLLAIDRPECVISFTNIEGNLSPEDCFFSRQVHEYPDLDPEAFLAGFTDRVRRSEGPSHALYASRVPWNVRAGAVAPLFRSIVELSDAGDLLGRFLSLPMPRMFMHGDQSRPGPYLPALREAGVEVVEIPASGHFPMYSNPPAMWAAIGDFVQSVDPE